jgi:hypothetical protein
MASAHLSVSAEVLSAFGATNSGGSERFHVLKIVGEEITLVSSSGSSGGDVASDFNGLTGHLATNQAAFVLFNLRPSEDKWLLVTWVPDMSAVRDKMLYSSSKTNLMKTIGLTYFTVSGNGEYYANEHGDLTYDAYLSSLIKVVELNEREQAMAAEKNDTIDAGGAGAAGKTSGMGTVPFALTPDAVEHLTKFAQGSIHYVSLCVNSNCTISLSPGFLEVTGVNIVGAVGSQKLAPKMTQNSPSFCAVRCIGKSITTTSETFVFCSPENSPIREKMTYSSAKSAAILEMKKLNILFDRNIEITDTADVDDYLKHEPVDDGTTASSAAATIVHAKPQRAGARKGTRKVAKFVADDE